MKKIIIAIILVAMTCGLLSMVITVHHMDEKIEELNYQLNETENTYKNYVAVTTSITDAGCTEMGFRYDDLLQKANEMAEILEDNGLDIPEYDNRTFENSLSDWQESIEDDVIELANELNLWN